MLLMSLGHGIQPWWKKCGYLSKEYLDAIVIGAHPHCSGIEYYDEKPIIYSLLLV